MQFPVLIKLHRSLFLLALLFAFHSLAAISVVVAPVPWFARLPLLLLIAISLCATLRPLSITGLSLSCREGLHCILVDDLRVPAKVLPGSAVFNHLIVLRLWLGDEIRVTTLALMPDQMTNEEFRILRLWLRWGVEPDVQENSACQQD